MFETHVLGEEIARRTERAFGMRVHHDSKFFTSGSIGCFGNHPDRRSDALTGSGRKLVAAELPVRIRGPRKWRHSEASELRQRKRRYSGRPGPTRRSGKRLLVGL
jgi:hypothetical protein